MLKTKTGCKDQLQGVKTKDQDPNFQSQHQSWDRDHSLRPPHFCISDLISVVLHISLLYYHCWIKNHHTFMMF